MGNHDSYPDRVKSRNRNARLAALVSSAPGVIGGVVAEGFFAQPVEAKTSHAASAETLPTTAFLSKVNHQVLAIEPRIKAAHGVKVTSIENAQKTGPLAAAKRYVLTRPGTKPGRHNLIIGWMFPSNKYLPVSLELVENASSNNIDSGKNISFDRAYTYAPIDSSDPNNTAELIVMTPGHAKNVKYRATGASAGTSDENLVVYEYDRNPSDVNRQFERFRAVANQILEEK